MRHGSPRVDRVRGRFATGLPKENMIPQKPQSDQGRE
jgi:hypothetical protein